MKNALPYALVALLPALFGSQALACYTVYNRANQVIYQAMAAPVDMRYQIHQTLPAVFPGGHLVFSVADSNCPAVNSSGKVTAAVNSLSSWTSFAPSPGEAIMQERSTNRDSMTRP
jgi:hypothetical protein